jgi:hypothetical protein
LLFEGQEFAARHATEFQEWRVASVRLLSKRASKIIQDNIALAIKDLILPFSKDIEPITSGNMHLSNLEAIFLSAINLDFTLQQQRAEYSFYPVLSDSTNRLLSYDEEKMIVSDEYFQLSDSQTPPEVKLVVEPGFYKFGDSQGRNWDVCSYLLKAGVELRSYGNR